MGAALPVGAPWQGRWLGGGCACRGQLSPTNAGVLWEWLFLDLRLSCGRMMWSLQSISNAFQMAAQQTGRLGLLPPEPGQS